MDALDAALKAAGITGVTATLDETGAPKAPPWSLRPTGIARSPRSQPPTLESNFRGLRRSPLRLPARPWPPGTTPTGGRLPKPVELHRNHAGRRPGFRGRYDVASGQLTFDAATGQLKTPPLTAGTINLLTGAGAADKAGALANGAVMNDITWDLYDPSEMCAGVSLQAREGDVISILGSSGSGKSTLLRCINLLETPDAAASRSPARRSRCARRRDGGLSPPIGARSTASAPNSAWCSRASTCGRT